MGATLDETRVELEAQRARVRGTATRLEAATRQSLNIKALVGRHPIRTAGLVAGAAFFLLGGPHRSIRAVRRALGGNLDGERAYAALPASLRALVDSTAPGHGAAKAEAKAQMALALHAWREDPKNRKKADRLVSETLTPPGPARAFWGLVEISAVTAAGIIGRRVVARRLMEGVFRSPSSPAATTPTAPTGQAVSPPAQTKRTVSTGNSTSGPAAMYTGWSGRTPAAADQARDPKPDPEPAPAEGAR